MSQQINLFNPIFLKQKKYFAALTMVQALAAILAFLVLLTLYAQWDVRSRTRQAAETTALLAKTKSQLIAVTTQFGVPKGDAALDGQIKKTELGVESVQRIFDALESGEFGDTKGYSAYFRSFARQIVDGVWLTGVNIEGAGHKIDLRGKAVQADLVPQYLRHLAHEEELKEKSFSTLDMAVPLVDAPPDPEGKVTKPPVPAPFIEFDLESSEANRSKDKPVSSQSPVDAMKSVTDWNAK